MLRNSLEDWGAVAKTLHWLVACLILLQLGLGLAAVSWHLSPTKLELLIWHKSIGMLILLLVLTRLGWRVTGPTPDLPPDTARWERLAARTSHLLLYLLMLALPLSGWVINSAANIPLKLFWVVPLPDIAAPNKPLEDAAALVHVVLVVALLLLLLVHIAAALRHHYIKRNRVLTRMLPFARHPL